MNYKFIEQILALIELYHSFCSKDKYDQIKFINTKPTGVNRYYHTVNSDTFIDFLLKNNNIDIDRIDAEFYCKLNIEKIHNYISKVIIHENLVTIITKLCNTKVIFYLEKSTEINNYIFTKMINTQIEIMINYREWKIKYSQIDNKIVSINQPDLLVDYNFLISLRESLTELTLGIRTNDLINTLIFPNLTFLMVTLHPLESSAYGYTIPDITTFLKNNLSINILRIKSIQLHRDLIDFLIQNTNIKQLTCFRSISIENVKKIIKYNTTLERLHVCFYGGEKCTIKYIPDNYKFLKINGRIIILPQVILNSKCEFIYGQSESTHQNVYNELLTSNINHMGLITYMKHTFLYCNAIKMYCDKILKKNTTLVMFLLYGKYFV